MECGICIVALSWIRTCYGTGILIAHGMLIFSLITVFSPTTI